MAKKPGLRKMVWVGGGNRFGRRRPEFVGEAQISPDSSIATSRAMSTP